MACIFKVLVERGFEVAHDVILLIVFLALISDSTFLRVDFTLGQADFVEKNLRN